MVCLPSMVYMFCIPVLPFEFEPVWKGGNFETVNLQMLLLCIFIYHFYIQAQEWEFLICPKMKTRNQNFGFSL